MSIYLCYPSNLCKITKMYVRTAPFCRTKRPRAWLGRLGEEEEEVAAVVVVVVVGQARVKPLRMPRAHRERAGQERPTARNRY